MSRSGQIISYTAEEALAVRLWDEERAGFYEAWDKLHAVLEEKDPDSLHLLRALDIGLGAVCMELTHVLHARLVRVFPHLADVITYLFYPEFMPVPPWVEQRGTPLPWVNDGHTRMVEEGGET